MSDRGYACPKCGETFTDCQCPLSVRLPPRRVDFLTRKERDDVEYWRAMSAGAGRVAVASRALLAIIDRIAPPPAGQGGK